MLMKKILFMVTLCLAHCFADAKLEQVAGAVDLDFGPNGTGFTKLDLGNIDVGNGIVLDSKKRIVVVGIADLAATAELVVARFSPDGVIDPTFGTDGPGFTKLNMGGNDQGDSIVLDSKGRIVVVGTARFGVAGNAAVARFSPDGVIDLGFGPDNTGFAEISFGGSDRGVDLVLDSKGRIVIVGNADSAGVGDLAVARFSPDGIIDLSFGPDNTGFATLSMTGGIDDGRGIVLDSKERIVVVGNANFAGVGDLAVARFSPDGIIDLGFGPDNTGFATLSMTGGRDLGEDIVLDSRGHIVVAGTSDSTGVGNLAVARFSPDGIIDPTFGTDGPGFTTLNMGGTDQGFKLVLDAKGRIAVVGGDDIFNIPGGLAVARFFGEEFTPCPLAIREKYCFLP